MTDLDDSDRRILRAVQQDASLSMDALAERVHLSRNACWRRLRQMEQDGLITGRVALVDPERVGCGLQVLVLLKISAHDPGWMTQFDAAVRDMPEIGEMKSKEVEEEMNGSEQPVKTEEN